MRQIRRILLGIMVAHFCFSAAGANAIWINAEDQGNGWKYLPWFGYFQEPAPDWIYHLEHGFMRVHGNSTDDFSLYDLALGSWFRVSDASYPILYKLGYEEGWYWYHPDSGPDLRIFRDLSTGTDLNSRELVEYLEPTYAVIPAGAFDMGDGLDATYTNGLERLPVHTVNVSVFHMQHTSVTNAQFARVMNWALSQGLVLIESEKVYNTEGDAQPLLHVNFWAQVKWDGAAFYVVPGKESYPCIGPSWYGALAYCNYLTRMEGTYTQAIDLADWSVDFLSNGYRLPTEAEWEKAARGGLVNHRFPWEDWWITHNDANYYAMPVGNAHDQSETYRHHPDWDTGVAPYLYTSVVGSFPSNGYGLYDMAGNVFDWCYDWFGQFYYDGSPSTNPLGPDTGTEKVCRGGCWDLGEDWSNVAYRYYRVPDLVTSNRIGFRAVRTATD